MNPKHLFIVFLAFLMILIGLALLLNSVELGRKAAEDAVGDSGRYPVEFNLLMAANVDVYKTTGLALLGIGGIFAFITMLHKDFLRQASAGRRRYTGKDESV